MYDWIGIILFPALLLFILLISKRNAAVKKIFSMNFEEKYGLLSELIYPFGYSYNRYQDIISSHNDAWQREFG